MATIVLSLVVLGSIWYLFRRLLIWVVAPDLAESIGISPARMELIFLMLVALSVAAGINFVGVLLMSALLIIPSVTAATIAGEKLSSFFIASGIVSLLAMTGALVGAKPWGIAPGIVVVLIGALCFGISVLVAVVKKKA